MIPDFQTIMLPLLNTLQDKQPKKVADIRAMIIEHFKISEDEQRTKTPSGKQFLYYNRVAWAITYLKMAGLIQSPERSIYEITQIGSELLLKNPEKINIKLLNEYPGFSAKRNPSKTSDPITTANDELDDRTPDELIETGYSKIRIELSNQLLEAIKSNSPVFFEKLVIDLLLKIGYGGNKIEYGEVVGKSGDEGIDGIIKEDKLGLDKIYIQAKRWENTVGRPDIQKFVGALQGKNASKGIFITTSNYSKEAVDYANNVQTNIVLIDGNELSELMIDYELGVSIKETYTICKVDTDYFVED